jgi:hypothetical protein
VQLDRPGQRWRRCKTDDFKLTACELPARVKRGKQIEELMAINDVRQRY